MTTHMAARYWLTAKGMAVTNHVAGLAPVPPDQTPCPQCRHWASHHTDEGGCRTCERGGTRVICGRSRLDMGGGR